MSQAALSASELAALREAFVRHGYTVEGVRELIGDIAHAALARNETTPAIRNTVDGSPLSALVRLWPLQTPVTTAAAELALPGLVEPLCSAGLLERSGGEVRARLDVRPYGDDAHDWWVVADLTPGLDGGTRRMAPDYVLGVSSASVSLAQLTVPDQVDRALDLGTGSGVQSLHLSTHSRQVVATDVNERALSLAALTAALNEVAVDFRIGSLYEPVREESFDLIVTNPPFVISSGRAELLTYRDSGLPGDEVVRRIVVDGARRLTPRGWLQVLANWAVRADEPWEERVGGWLEKGGCDVWVVERERLDPAQYVELWLDDAGLRGAPEYRTRYDAWLGWLEEERVEAIGLGWISARRTAKSQPCLRIEAWPFEVEQPIGREISAWARRLGALDRLDDAALPDARLVAHVDVSEERSGRPGDADPATIVLRSTRGMRRARQLTTAQAAFVGACDGELTVRQIVAALATLLDTDVAALAEEIVPLARDLVVEDFLELP